MEWLELLKLIDSANTNATLAQRVEAQGQALKALSEQVLKLAKLDSEVARTVAAHNDAILGLYVVSVLGILLLAGLIVYYGLLMRKIDRRLAALERMTLSDDAALEVTSEHGTIMRLTLAQLKAFAAFTGKPVPIDVPLTPTPKSTP